MEKVLHRVIFFGPLFLLIQVPFFPHRAFPSQGVSLTCREKAGEFGTRFVEVWSCQEIHPACLCLRLVLDVCVSFYFLLVIL